MTKLGSFWIAQAVNQLCSHFEAYSDIPKITELREKFKGIKDMLKSHVFSDFSRLVVNHDGDLAALNHQPCKVYIEADACRPHFS